MWHLIGTALHLAVHASLKKRQQSASVPQQPRYDAVRERPSIGAWAVLGVVIGGCCLSSGLLSALGSVLTLAGEMPREPDTDPWSALFASAFLCLLPSALALSMAGLSIYRTMRMRRLVALAESRMALDHEDVATSLGIDLETARTLLDTALREGFVDRALVEATEPHGSSSDLPPPPAQHIATPVTPTPGQAKERVCPFCKAVTRTDGDQKPRCVQCGIPFSSRA